MIPTEIIFVAPLFSRQIPIITPNNISNPIFFEVNKNPLKISDEVFKKLRSNDSPRIKQPIEITSIGFNFKFDVPTIIHITVIKRHAIS